MNYFARPWWVNLLIIFPIIAYFIWKKSLRLSNGVLCLSGIFGIAFGFVESSVVVYLRGAIGFFSDAHTLLPHRMFALNLYRQSHLLAALPKNLLTVELYRETATIAMIFCVASLAAQKAKEKWAIFFWVFAFWDIFYYVGLKLSIYWPRSLTDSDILFLLPVPWFAQVWYPILTSLLFILAVLFSREKIK